MHAVFESTSAHTSSWLLLLRLHTHPARIASLQALAAQSRLNDATLYLELLARAVCMARATDSCVLECLHTLHSARLELLMHISPQPLLATVACLLLSPLPDDHVLPAVLVRLQRSGAINDAALVAEPDALYRAAQHCFLTPIAWRLLGADSLCSAPQRPAGLEAALAASPAEPATLPAAPKVLPLRVSQQWSSRSAVNSPATGARTPAIDAVVPLGPAGPSAAEQVADIYAAPLTALQRAALLLFDAAAALQWCAAQAPTHQPTRGSLARLFTAAEMPEQARQQLMEILCGADNARFAPETVQRCPGDGPRALQSDTPLPQQLTEPRKAGRRPEQSLGPHMCSPPSTAEFAARLQADMVLYIALCRQTKALGALVDVVEWGVTTEWGHTLPPRAHLHVSMSDFAPFALSAALVDTAASLRARVVTIQAGLEELTAEAVLPALQTATRHALVSTPTTARPLLVSVGTVEAQATAPASRAHVQASPRATAVAGSQPAFALPTEEHCCSTSEQSTLVTLHGELKAAWRLYRLLTLEATGATGWLGVPPALQLAAEELDEHDDVTGGPLDTAAMDLASEAMFCMFAKVRSTSRLLCVPCQPSLCNTMLKTSP